MLLLGLGALIVPALVALGLIWRRQQRLAQQVGALLSGVDRVRVDVAEVQRAVGLDHERDARYQPSIVRRRRHLGLVGGIASGLGIGATWAREHLAASLTAAAVVVAGASLLIVTPWHIGSNPESPSSAPTANSTATAEPPSGSPSSSLSPPPGDGRGQSEETVPPAPGDSATNVTTNVTEVSDTSGTAPPSSSASAATSADEETGVTEGLSSPGSTPAPEWSGPRRRTQQAALPAGTVSLYLTCAEISAMSSVELSACLGGNT